MTPNGISVVVLNWNGKDVIDECIRSLLAQSYSDFEIILVDNGSTDGSLQTLRLKYAQSIRIIANPVNLGFAEGCNVGIRASKGSYIALVNSDAVVDRDWLTELMKVMGESKKTGMCASKIYFADKPDTIENTGQTITRDGLGRTRGRLEKDQGQYNQRSRIFCPSGCAAIYRRELLDAIGLFDAKFFAYADDIDVGVRGRLIGYECEYVPSAIAYHKLSASFGLLSSFKAYLVERNRLWVLIKCFPLRHLMAAPYHTLKRYFYHFLGIFFKKGPAAHFVEKTSVLELAWIAVKVYLSTLWHLPYLLAERARIRKKRVTTTADFENWLRLYGLSDKEAALNELSF